MNQIILYDPVEEPLYSLLISIVKCQFAEVKKEVVKVINLFGMLSVIDFKEICN